MSEQGAVWYYTQHGERKGPVTLEVLKGAIMHMKVDREKDLIWGPGLASWVKVAEVPELAGLSSGPPPVIETSAQPTATPVANPVLQKPVVAATPSAPVKSATAVNPYQAPTSVDDEDNALADAMAERHRSGKGARGLGRVLYMVLQIVFYALLVVGLVVVAGVSSNVAVGAEDSAMGVGVIVGIGVYVIASLLTTLSRLTHLGMSRWSVLWMFVPFMNLWLGFRLYACPAGYHHSRKLDLGGKIVVALYILLIVLYCVAVGMGFSSGYQKGLEGTQRKVDLQQSGVNESYE